MRNQDFDEQITIAIIRYRLLSINRQGTIIVSAVKNNSISSTKVADGSLVLVIGSGGGGGG
jgi:hypothetical protein